MNLDDVPGVAAVAAEQLGMSAAIVEKDYWLTRTLRVLSQVAHLRFVLKGGTSLSKGWNLIERFSGDVDVLLVPGGNDLTPTATQDLVDLIRVALADDGFAIEEHHAQPGFQTSLYLDGGQQTRLAGLDARVRLDYGAGGSSMPMQEVAVEPLLTRAFRELGRDPTDYDDLGVVHVQALHPARTTIEKLLIVDAVSRRLRERMLAGASDLGVRSRDVRHYYDLHYLLDPSRSPAVEYLRTHDIPNMVDECIRVSNEQFGGSLDVAWPLVDGLGLDDDAMGTILEARYAQMIKVLVNPGSQAPTWSQVVETLRGADVVRGHAS